MGKWPWTEGMITIVLNVLREHRLHELIIGGELPRRHHHAWLAVYNDQRIVTMALEQQCTNLTLANRIIYKKAKALFRKGRLGAGIRTVQSGPMTNGDQNPACLACGEETSAPTFVCHPEAIFCISCCAEFYGGSPDDHIGRAYNDCPQCMGVWAPKS